MNQKKLTLSFLYYPNKDRHNHCWIEFSIFDCLSAAGPTAKNKKLSDNEYCLAVFRLNHQSVYLFSFSAFYVTFLSIKMPAIYSRNNYRGDRDRKGFEIPITQISNRDVLSLSFRTNSAQF